MKRIHVSRSTLAALVLAMLLAACGRDETPVDARQTPVATAIEPSAAPVGSEVIISGRGFGSDQSALAVTFAGRTGELRSVTPTRIVATVPTGATSGSVDVTLNGTRIGTSPFVVTASTSTPSSERKWTETTVDFRAEELRGIQVTMMDTYVTDSSEVDLGTHCTGGTGITIDWSDTFRIGGLLLKVDTVRRVFTSIEFATYNSFTWRSGNLTSQQGYSDDGYRIGLNDIPYTVAGDGALTASITGAGVGRYLKTLDKTSSYKENYYAPKRSSHIARILPFTPASRVGITLRPAR